MNLRKLTVVLFLILFLFGFQVYGIMSGNDSDCGFRGQDCGGTRALSTTTQLKPNLIQAAGYYLKMRANMAVFFNLVEVGEIEGYDFPSMNYYLSMAIQDLEEAGEKYIDLVNDAKTLDYDPGYTDFLQNFDYDSFKDSNGLYQPFDLVKEFLKKGDIVACYEYLRDRTFMELDALKEIIKAISETTLPLPDKLRNADHSIITTALFGQYVARVFAEKS